MNRWKLFRSSRPSRSARPISQRLNPSTAKSLYLEPLEARFLLAGNLDVNFFGDNVQFRGDSSANEVEVAIEAGDIVVRGQNNTTINGSSSPFVLRDGSTSLPGTLRVFLGDGDDIFSIQGAIQIGGGLHAWTGSGSDHFGVDGVSVAKSVLLFTGGGKDGAVLQRLTVGDHLIVGMGEGDDTLHTQLVQVGGNLIANTGRGDEAIVVEETSVQKRLVLNTASGNDTVSVVESSTQEDATIRTGVDNDFVSIQSTEVGTHLNVVSARGDDAVDVGGTTSIGTFLMGLAGLGQDSLRVAPSVTIGDSKRIVVLVESETIDQALIDERLNDPQTGALARVSLAREVLGFSPLADLSLTISTAANATVPSHGTLLTEDPSFTISGNTDPGALVQIARDGDGIFNDGTTTADANGNFSIDVTLTHTNANRGANPIVVRAQDEFSRTATQSVDVHLVVGTVVRMTTNLGFIDMELLDDDASTFVANFLNYLTDYTNSIVHRVTRTASDGLAVIQGGGFVLSGSNVTEIVSDPPIDNDFDPDNPHIRGALSMARLGGDPDSATSEWFINTASNQTLNNQQFTVFGYVIGSSLPVVDAIAALSDFDIAAFVGQTALKEVPLQNYTSFSVAIAGTVAMTSTQSTVTGTGTSFTTEIPADKKIRIAGQVFNIATVDSDTQLTLVLPASITVSGQTAQVNPAPVASNYVTTSSVIELSV